MVKKEIQKQRIKEYFIDAAKNIVINEGFQQVSVRKVADLAGYSYATIYNYFDNLDHLLWHVGLDILKDLGKMLEEKANKKVLTAEDFKETLKFYVDYFYNNPNVFTFFFFHQSGERPKELDEELEKPMLVELMARNLKGFVDEGKIKPQHIEVVTQILTFSMHGMLLMSFSNKANVSKEEVHKSLDLIVDYILSRN